MTYKKYRKTLETNYSVLDGVKCEGSSQSRRFEEIFLICIVSPFLAMILIEIVGRFFFEEPSDEISVLVLSISASLLFTRDICTKNNKKWTKLVNSYKEMQHQRCLELALPLILRKGKSLTSTGAIHTYYYVTFVMPAEFEAEFYQFRKNDTCRKLIFDYKLDDNWISKNLKECQVEVVNRKMISTYTFKGIKPISLLES